MTRSMTRWTLAGCMALAALGAVAVFDVAPATADAASSVVSTVSDPVGDTFFNFNAPFQDFVRGQMTKTASGDFELLMEMASPVPVNPPLSPPGRSEIWWFWIFDLDPTTRPVGYPWKEAAEAANVHGTPQEQTGRPPEFIVYVSWDGNKFAGNAIDRRPLLTGGEAIITPVPFSINGTIVEAVLSSELIGAVPASFGWGPFTANWSGPVGSEGFHFADYCETRVSFP